MKKFFYPVMITMSVFMILLQPAFAQIVENDVDLNANISDFSITSNEKNKRLYVFSYPNKLLSEVENKGNVTIIPSGAIVIKDIFDETVSEIAFNESSVAIAPDEVKTIATPIDSEDLLLGRYTAELSMSFGQDEEVVRTDIFWILPWNILIAAILGLVLLILSLLKMRKIYHSRLLKKHGIYDEGTGT